MAIKQGDRPFAINMPEDLFDELDRFLDLQSRLRKKDVGCAAVLMFMAASTEAKNAALQAVQERYYRVPLVEDAGATPVAGGAVETPAREPLRAEDVAAAIKAGRRRRSAG